MDFTNFNFNHIYFKLGYWRPGFVILSKSEIYGNALWDTFLFFSVVAVS